MCLCFQLRLFCIKLGLNQFWHHLITQLTLSLALVIVSKNCHISSLDHQLELKVKPIRLLGISSILKPIESSNVFQSLLVYLLILSSHANACASSMCIELCRAAHLASRPLNLLLFSLRGRTARSESGELYSDGHRPSNPMTINCRLIAHGTGTINGYTKSDWHDIDIKLIDAKKKATEVLIITV